MQNKHKERAERAKLFLPFDSLKGFHEYLRAAEHVVVERKELSVEDLEYLDYQLSMLTTGTMVRVIFYVENRQEYVEVTGLISKMGLDYQRRIMVVNQWISIDDIVGLDIVRKE